MRYGATRASRLAAELAAHVPGHPADVELLAQMLSIRVVRAALGVGLYGLTTNKSTVVLNTDMDESRSRFTLAHELAHVLVLRGLLHCEPSGEEIVADDFARHLLLPREAAGFAERSVAELAEEHGLPVEEVLVQRLRFVPGEPEVAVAQTGAISCVHCGVNLPRAGCICAAYRARRTPAA